jgi:hypothetical protein
MYVRNLFASLHPPLPPRSTRESKQLLNVLESAFQRRLDETHPSPKVADHPAAGGAAPTSANDELSIPDPARKVTHSTHSHLDSILNHPLLRRKSTTLVPAHSLTATAVATFDAALVGKRLDPHLVQFCTLQYLEGLEKKENISKDGRLGPRLADWFTSMDNAEKKDMLVNHKSIANLVSVMYSDGLEAEAWEWLRFLYERQFETTSVALQPPEREGLDATSHYSAEDRIVAAMISELLARKSFQEAAQLYVEACVYRQKTGTRQTTTPPPLKKPWRILALSILSWRTEHQIPPGLFDLLLQHGLSTHQVNSSFVDHSLLRVYHPTAPSAAVLCRKLRHRPSSAPHEPLRDHHHPPKKRLVSRSTRVTLLVALLDAAQLSLDQGRPQDARTLVDYAEREFPDFLATHKELATERRLELAQESTLVRKLNAARTRQTPYPALA